MKARPATGELITSIGTRRIALVAALSLLGCKVDGDRVDTEDLRATQPLLENWKFLQDDDLTDEAALAATAEDWETVELPHTWNTEDHARGLGWYRLELARPITGARHWLEVGAASLVADVWLNGEKLGQHRGGFTQFRFDITDALARSGPNVLLVKTDNRDPRDEDDPTAIDPLGGDHDRSGGLYRHVALISTRAAVHFDLGDLGGPGVYASTATIAGAEATVDVRARIASDATRDGDYRVRFSLVDDAGKTAASVERSIRLAAGEQLEVTAALDVVDPHLWQGLDDPYLYQLVAELQAADGTRLDNVVQDFGIREMHFDPDEGFFLNGEQLRLKGVAMHQDFLGRGWAVTDDDLDTSLALVREVGANAVRLGHYPFSRHAMERITELGLVAWVEKPSGLRTTVADCAAQPTEAYLENARLQLQETIRQNYNHAAVAVWSIGSDTETDQLGCDEPTDNVTPYLRELNALAKREDPGRATASAEGTAYGSVAGDVPLTTAGITDVLGTNRYYLWDDPDFEKLRGVLAMLHEDFPRQTIGVSAYGAGAALGHHTDNPLGGPPEVGSAPEGEVSYQPEEYAAYVHEQNWRVIATTPFLWGSFVSNMFDFGAAQLNEGDVPGVDTRGLVTFDRELRKDPFFFYKANWSDQPVTYITGRRHVDRAYAVNDIKIYSNADSVELLIDGRTIGTRTRAQCELAVCVFEDVPLRRGVNRVTAVGAHAGLRVFDEVKWSLDTHDVNIAAGRLATGYVSSQGARFGSDDFFSGGRGAWIGDGEVRGGAPEIAGTDDPLLYTFFRAGDFRYDIPLLNGTYAVTLGFVEPDADVAPGERVFTVTANDEVLLEDFDVRRAAGADLAVFTRTFTVEVTGGRLVLGFDPTRGEALVSNITITTSELSVP